MGTYHRSANSTALVVAVVAAHAFEETSCNTLASTASVKLPDAYRGETTLSALPRSACSTGDLLMFTFSTSILSISYYFGNYQMTGLHRSARLARRHGPCAAKMAQQH